MTFTATDGTVFETRQDYRAHEMLTQYTFSNKTSETLTKLPNTVQGQPIDICDCTDCTIAILDYTDMVQIDNAVNCKIFIAGSSESLFIRDCRDCTFTVACKQLRTRDCHNCTFYLYSKTEPIIETSDGMKFAPFNGAFDGHEDIMKSACLIPKHNLWFAVYDFNDNQKTGMNWRILDQAEEDPLWTPLGAHANCCPRVLPGSIALPSEGADTSGVTQSGGMQSFSLGTSLHEAAAATGDAFLAQETETKAEAKGGKASGKSKGKSKIGWNPGAAASAPAPAAVSASASAPVKSGKVGWNPDAAAPAKSGKVCWNPDAASSPAPAPASVPAPVTAEAKAKSKIGWNPDAATSAPILPTPTPTPTTATTTTTSPGPGPGSTNSNAPSASIAVLASTGTSTSTVGGAAVTEVATKPRVGWNPLRLPENGGIVTSDVVTKCENPTLTPKNGAGAGSFDEKAAKAARGRSRTESEVTSAHSGEKGVTLELQALLLFAVERGVDLVKWFLPDSKAEKKIALVNGLKGPDLLLTKAMFAERLTGLGLGLGAGQDVDTQSEIAAGISQSSIDTVARPRNCDAFSPHPVTELARISMRSIFEVSCVENCFTTPSLPAPALAATLPPPAPAAVSLPKAAAKAARPPPPVVNVPPIKHAAPLPVETKPFWSPSANNHNQHKAMSTLSTLSSPNDGNADDNADDLELEIESCLRSLARQADSYHKLRTRLQLDSNEERGPISAKEITKVLAELGLKLGPAGIAAMFRRVCGVPVDDVHTPASIDAAMLRDYLLKLKLKKEIKWGEWAAQKKDMKELELERNRLEFQKALGGVKFELEEEEYDELIESFEIISPEMVKKEIHARAVEWLNGVEGVRVVRRKALEEEHLKKGSLDGEEKEVIFKLAKAGVLDAYKVNLLEEEKANLSTSKTLFREYVAINKKQKFEETVPFSEWAKTKTELRVKVKDARKDWLERKASVSKLKDLAGSKVAAISDVESLVRDLVASACFDTQIEGGVNVSKPSRKGIELAKKLRELERLSGDGKVVSKATFDEVMHDVIFSLRAERKTSKQAKALAIEFDVDTGAEVETTSSPSIFEEDEGGAVAKRALDLINQKKSDADKEYKTWLKAKRMQAKKAKKEIRVEGKKKVIEDAKRKIAADEAYANWLELHQSKKYYSFKHKVELTIPKLGKGGVKKTDRDEWQALSIDENGVGKVAA